MVELRNYLQTPSSIKNWIRPAQLIDITDGSHESTSFLERRVEESRGEVAILVHPFYNDGKWASWYPLTKEYRDRVEEFVDTANQRGTPVVVFEKKDSASQLTKKLPLEPSSFVVKTISTAPFPAIKNIPASESGSTQETLDGFVVDSLAHSGVVKANVGGRFLFVEKYHSENPWLNRFPDATFNLATARQWIDHSEYPNGCVGGVIKGLFRAGIEANVVPATSPRVSFDYYIRNRMPVSDLGLLP